MKKLIAMIGAVATAFGLYAAEPAKFATSFEANEPGVEGTTFTPGTGWTWGSEDALTLGTYDGDKYVYGTGAFARRDSEFTVGLDSQVNYLKLETGTNALSRAVGGNVFLDQLVKFTGFEEYQTNVVSGTKIAVWMSGIEQEGTPAVPGNGEPEEIDNGEGQMIPNPDYVAPIDASSDYIAGETNLYITCAKVVDGKVQTVALKINGSYELDKWYRLTIKSIGDIYDADKRQSEDPRAGFIVYVDGNQVAAVDDAATTLIEYDSEMTAAAKGYMAAKQLFPAIDNTDATFATVGYQGIGAIDDIILDTDGPEFARTVDVTAEQLFISGAKIVKVTQDGEIVTGDGVWKVKAGNIVVWYAPDGAYVFKGEGNATATWSVSGDGAEKVVDSQTFEVVAAAVKVGDNYYETVEEALVYVETQQDVDPTATFVVEFLQECSSVDKNYSFTPGTTITITEGGNWDVFVGSYMVGELGEETEMGSMSDYFGLAAEKQVIVGFESEESYLGLAGKIAGDGEVETILCVTNGYVYLDYDITIGDETGAGATLEAASISNMGISGDASKITLGKNGKVITLEGSGLTAADFIVDGELDISDPDEDGYITYSVAQSAPAEAVATVTLAGGQPVEYTDLHAALVAGSVAGAVVELVDDVDLTGINWVPVPNFLGKFDGKGKTISNLKIDIEGGNAGLFGDNAWGKNHNGICNLVISNADVKATGNNVGVLAAKNGSDGGCVISNVTVCGNIKVIGESYVGGLVGHNQYSHIIDCHVIGDGTATSVIGYGEVVDDVLKGSGQIGGLVGMTGEGNMHVWNCSVEKVSVKGTGLVGGIWGRMHDSSKMVGCTATDVNVYCSTNVEVAIVKIGTLVGGFVGGGLAPVINCSASNVNLYTLDGTPIEDRWTGTVAEGKNVALGTGVEGDAFTFKFSNPKLTAGTFEVMSDATVSSLAGWCQTGYAPVANQDGTYTITQVFPIEVVNVGGNATVTLDGDPAPTTVVAGGTIKGKISGVDEGYNAFVYVDGVKATVDNEGKFEGTATASAKITVAYAKASAWYLDPFVKNDGAVVKKMDFGVDRMGDIVLSADGSKLYSAPGWQNYIACDGGYTGLLQFNVPLISSFVGSYFKIENGQLGSSSDNTSINSNYEAFRSIVPVGNDYVVIGQTRGAEIRHQDYPGMSAQSSIYPIGGDWGDTKFGGTTDGDSRYVCYSDINMGTAVTAAADPTMLQWHTAGVVSSDGKYLYLAQYARNEIVKLALSKDTEGKAVWTKTGIWWHTKDEDIFNGNACNALALLPTANGDVVFASLSDGRLVKLNETTLSGNTFVDHHEGATAKVADYKMDLVANLGTIRAMKVTGVADGLPHLQVFKFDKANSALMIYALTADGDLVSTTPIATYQGGNAQITNGYYQNVVSSDDETIAFAHYEDKPDRSNYSCEQTYRMATITAKPAQVTVRTTFNTYEEGTDTMVNYGTDAKVAIAPSAGYLIASVKVNGEPMVGFNPAGFEFEEADIARNVYIEMTQEKAPFIILIGSDGTEKARYADLNVAFAAAAEGDTVKLLQDAAIETAATMENKNIIFDLGGYTLSNAKDDENLYLIDMTNSTLVITNGTMAAGKGEALENVGAGSHITIACDATLTGSGSYTFYPTAATVDIYGKITTTAGESTAVWLTGNETVVNVYDGAVLTSNGDVFRHRSKNGAATLNIYGGTMTAGSGYPIIYAYGDGNVGTVNIYGGTLNKASTADGLFSDNSGKVTITIGPKAGETECTAKFSSIGKHGWASKNFADYVVPGYAPVLGGDGYYTIQKVYDVTIAPTENGTVETSVTNGIVAGTEVTITATPAANYEVDTIAVTNGDQEVTVESNKFQMPAGNVTVYVTFKSTATPGWSEDPTKDAGKAADEVYPAIADSSVLAKVDAGTLGGWAKENSVDFNEFIVDPDTFENAFLLDCAPGEVETEKAKFKFTEIVPGTQPTIGEAGKYGNGKVVVYGATKLGADADWAVNKEGATFYKAELVPVQFNENAAD